MNAPSPDQPPAVPPIQPPPVQAPVQAPVAQAPVQPPTWDPAGYAQLPGYPQPPLTGYPPPSGGTWHPPGFPGPIPVGPGGAPLASFGERLLAYLIDMLVLSAVGMVFAVPVFVAFFAVLIPEMGTEGELTGRFIVLILLLEAALVVVMMAVAYIYYVEYLRREGQTLGKKVMKLKVVPLDPTQTLSRQHCAKRYLIQFVAGSFIPFFSYVDGFWQLWDKPYQQCLHDKVGQTVVVKVPAS